MIILKLEQWSFSPDPYIALDVSFELTHFTWEANFVIVVLWSPQRHQLFRINSQSGEKLPSLILCYQCSVCIFVRPILKKKSQSLSHIVWWWKPPIVMVEKCKEKIWGYTTLTTTVYMDQLNVIDVTISTLPKLMF
jgi:hypothetical protein